MEKDAPGLVMMALSASKMPSLLKADCACLDVTEKEEVSKPGRENWAACLRREAALSWMVARA